MTTSPISLAFFISSHGFGHAARSVAIMNAIHERLPWTQFEIFTLTPAWFFKESLRTSYHLHPIKTDVGLVQSTPFREDLNKTLDELAEFLPLKQERIDSLAKRIYQAGCRLVLCDISPLGIAVAHACGIPSLLIENFTWDWIYALYTEEYPHFLPYIEYLSEIFTHTDYHIQTEPVCDPQKAAHLTTFPVSRKPQTSAANIRQLLNIPSYQRMVLVTMGGIPNRFEPLGHLSYLDDICLVIPGGSPRAEYSDHLILLPHHSNFYHPDLVFASDAVVGKAGYSTIAEVYYAGIPFGFINRPNFRESPVMTKFIQLHLSSLEISASQFQDGGWTKLLPQLVSLPHIQHLSLNGADQVAGFIENLLYLNGYNAPKPS